jgi:hypothetical protein
MEDLYDSVLLLRYTLPTVQGWLPNTAVSDLIS